MLSTLRIAALGLRNPALGRCMVLAFVIGAVGGTIPGAFAVVPDGAGVGVGASWGARALAFASPIVTVYLAAAIAASRFESGTDRDLFVCGRSWSATATSDLLGAAAAASVLLLPALAGGAVAGGADAAARGSALWTSPELAGVAFYLAAVCLWSVLVVLLVALTRSSVWTFLAIAGMLVAGLVAVQVADTQPVWDAIGVSPVGLITVPAETFVANRYDLATQVPLVLVASAAWIGLASLITMRVRRSSPPL